MSDVSFNRQRALQAMFTSSQQAAINANLSGDLLLLLIAVTAMFDCLLSQMDDKKIVYFRSRYARATRAYNVAANASSGNVHNGAWAESYSIAHELKSFCLIEAGKLGWDRNADSAAELREPR
jgi:hypothetical protein